MRKKPEIRITGMTMIKFIFMSNAKDQNSPSSGTPSPENETLHTSEHYKFTLIGQFHHGMVFEVFFYS